LYLSFPTAWHTFVTHSTPTSPEAFYIFDTTYRRPVTLTIAAQTSMTDSLKQGRLNAFTASILLCPKQTFHSVRYRIPMLDPDLHITMPSTIILTFQFVCHFLNSVPAFRIVLQTIQNQRTPTASAMVFTPHSISLKHL